MGDNAARRATGFSRPAPSIKPSTMHRLRKRLISRRLRLSGGLRVKGGLFPRGEWLHVDVCRRERAEEFRVIGDEGWSGGQGPLAHRPGAAPFVMRRLAPGAGKAREIRSAQKQRRWDGEEKSSEQPPHRRRLAGLIHKTDSHQPIAQRPAPRAAETDVISGAEGKPRPRQRLHNWLHMPVDLPLNLGRPSLAANALRYDHICQLEIDCDQHRNEKRKINNQGSQPSSRMGIIRGGKIDTIGFDRHVRQYIPCHGQANGEPERARGTASRMRQTGRSPSANQLVSLLRPKDVTPAPKMLQCRRSR